MVRSMFGHSVKQKEESKLGITKVETKGKTKLAVSEKLLRRKRSEEYMNAIRNLDVGGGVKSLSKEFYEALNNEFPEIDLGGNLIGIISKCYLGGSYEVHTLDCARNIVEHYEKGQVLPNGMEKARSLANNDRYEFIEVYTDRCCAVDFNGNVSIVKE